MARASTSHEAQANQLGNLPPQLSPHSYNSATTPQHLCRRAYLHLHHPLPTGLAISTPSGDFFREYLPAAIQKRDCSHVHIHPILSPDSFMESGQPHQSQLFSAPNFFLPTDCLAQLWDYDLDIGNILARRVSASPLRQEPCLL